jgi:hypothetical protein
VAARNRGAPSPTRPGDGEKAIFKSVHTGEAEVNMILAQYVTRLFKQGGNTYIYGSGVSTVSHNGGMNLAFELYLIV